MGKHSEPEGERRRGGLRWKGDTTGSIPVIPEWAGHEGIADHNVDEFVAAIHSTNPPGTNVPEEHARYAWMIERAGADGWHVAASGYTAAPYRSNAEAAADLLGMWFLWNGVTTPGVRKLHTMWVRHATEAGWTERLDGR